MTGAAFLDTNVILYSFDPTALHHARSKALVERTRNHEANLWVSPQIFCEVFRYVTHPKAISPRKPAEVLSDLEALLARPGLNTLPVPPDLTVRIVRLLRDYPTLRGRQVFDVQIAATMLGNDLHRIFTFNTSDFLFAGIDAVEPPTLDEPQLNKARAPETRP